MAGSVRTGVSLAFLCLGLLGVMPVLAQARPAGFDGLTFAVWVTVWQLLAALPLFLLETVRRRTAAAPVPSLAALYRGRTGLITVSTGAMFGLSTYLYVVAADKAGPVGTAIALQAYPLFAIAVEAAALGKRKSAVEIACTVLMLIALSHLVTGGTFRIAAVSWWTVFALTIPLIWSVAHVLLKRVLDTTPVTPNQVTVTRLAVSGLALLLLHAATGRGGALLDAMTDVGFQRAAILLGVAYYLELILWFHAMRTIDVSLASSVTVPAPAVTMLVAVLVLGEEIAVHQVAAMVVLAAGLYGLLIAGRRRGAP